MLYVTTKEDLPETKEQIKSLFKTILEFSSQHNKPILPTLGMFSNINQLALRIMNVEKEEWGNLMVESSEAYMNDTNSIVNGVLIINEARMMKLSEENESTAAKVMHYMKTVGTMEGCPYLKAHDVALCQCSFRNSSDVLFMSTLEENQENGTRSFSKIVDLCEEEEYDSLSGKMADITKKIFQLPLSYQDISC